MAADDLVTREQAIAIARKAARATQPRIDAFDVDVADEPPHWMVEFTNRAALSDGADQHLAVRVDKRTGETRIFHGR
jgi:hypothetical protein